MPVASDPTILPTLPALVGAALLVIGEAMACARWRNLAHVLFWSTLAECGLVLIGISGGEVGRLGGAMHVVYQVAMRGLMIGAAMRLVDAAGGWSLDRLTGAGRTSPTYAVLFAFGMFSVLGLSPFKGALSRFVVLYDVIERGQWPIAAAMTVASILAAIYAVRVIQAIVFAEPTTDIPPARPRWSKPFDLAVLGLAVVTAVFNLAPEAVEAVVAATFGLRTHLPPVEGPWPTLVLVPYLGAFVIWGLGLVSRGLRDVAAVGLAAATFGMAIGSGGVDPTSHVFAVLFAGVLLLVALYSTAYMRHEGGETHYWFFFFLMSGSLLGVATAGDLGSFYLFWELMTWSSYLLIVHSRSQEALRAGVRYFVMCAGGAYVMLVGIVAIVVRTDSFEIAGLAQRVGAIDTVTGTIAVAALLIGLGVKAGLVPLHGWLPVAHPAAPSAISAPLSSILTKTGILGLLKLLIAGFGVGLWGAASGDWSRVGPVISVIGVVTLLWGEVQAWRQDDVKRMLAYSTIAQVGEITAVLGLGGTLAVTAATTHVLVHGVMKTLLFLGVGALVMRAGSRRIADLSGIGRTMPWTAGFLVVGLLSIMGLPPFGGFVGKFAMIWASVRSGATPVAVALLLGGVIGVLYYGRLIRVVLFDPASERAAAARDAPWAMIVPLGVAAAGLIVIGLAPQTVFAPAIAVAADIAVQRGVTPEVWPMFGASWSWAAVVAAIAGFAALVVGRFGRVPAGVVVVVGMAMAFVAVIVQADRYDPLSFAFALVIAGVGGLNLLHAVGYMAHHGHAPARFFAAFALMIAGLLGMAGAEDLFGFFFFWEIMSSWTLWFAIVHDETPEALREGTKYFVFNIVGASFLFLGVVVTATAAGSFAFADLATGVARMSWTTALLGPGAMFLGFAMKAAMLTARVDWQMHPSPAPTPVSGYISAVLLKSGPLGVLKFAALFGGTAALSRFGTLGGLDGFGYTLAVIGAVTAIWAGAMAFVQTGVKRLLIYSTVSQLGYVMCGLALGDPLSTAGGLSHAFNHVFLKDTLFLAAGAILAQRHVVDLDELGGVGRRMPWTFACFAFAGLSLAGLPPLNGLASKWLLYEGALASGHPFLALALLGGSLTTLAAVLKFVHAGFLGAPSPTSAGLHEAPAAMLVPMVAMCLISGVLGVFPGFALVPIAQIQVALGITPIEASWFGPLPGPWGWHPAALWLPLLVLGAIGWATTRLRTAGRRVTHAHSCGVDIDPSRMRVAASQLYSSPDRLVRRLLPIHEERS